MFSMPILIKNALRMSRGISRVPAPFRLRQAVWLLRQQRRDGGFAGRLGASNMYYTGFAMRLAQLLDVRSPDFWEGLRDYLRLKTTAPKDFPDAFMRLLARPMLQLRGLTLWPPADEPERVGECRRIIDAGRVRDGYVRRPGGSLSVFQAFHAAVVYELLGDPMPGADRVIRALHERQRPDGGWVDMPESADASGTNPVAAAVGALDSLGGLDDATALKASRFAASMQRTDGGFLAHAQAPMTDLLSTFSAIGTLHVCGHVRLARLADGARYVRTLAFPGGGFLAVAADDEPDIEYTYYGVSSLALLAAELAAA